MSPPGSPGSEAGQPRSWARNRGTKPSPNSLNSDIPELPGSRGTAWEINWQEKARRPAQDARPRRCTALVPRAYILFTDSLHAARLYALFPFAFRTISTPNFHRGGEIPHFFLPRFPPFILFPFSIQINSNCDATRMCWFRFNIYKINVFVVNRAFL